MRDYWVLIPYIAHTYVGTHRFELNRGDVDGWVKTKTNTFGIEYKQEKDFEKQNLNMRC